MNKILAFVVLATLAGAYADLECPPPGKSVMDKMPEGFNMDSISDDLKSIIKKYEEDLKAGKVPETRDEDNPTDVILARNGYPCDSITVTTEDCYILTMHRIPFGVNSPIVAGEVKPAVLLQHGLLMSSADWVIADPTKGLGYILADAGYDVWMGNFRGNTYSRQHCTIDPDRDNDFWHFSWDQNGKWDLPAMIDTIQLYTGQEKIHYVGHSMGTTSLMVMTQERPEYMDKLIMANLMSPVAYMEHMESPIRLLAPFDDIIELITEIFGLGEFLPSNALWDLIANLFCDPLIFDPILCESVIFLLVGFDESQMNETLLPDIVEHTPAGSSTYTVIHYAQEVEGGFHKYDLDGENERCYGVDYPPEYYPANFNMPLSLYWGQNDWLASTSDILTLVSQLPYIYDDYEVPYEQWNHMDFIYGIDAPTLVWEQVMSNMARAQDEFYPIAENSVINTKLRKQQKEN